MAKKTIEEETSKVVAALEPLAKGLKVAVEELWGIFVRQYVVKGISELFTAILLVAVAYLSKDAIGYWAFIPLSVAIYLVYDVINLLGNPQYFALEDLSKRVRSFDDKK